MEINALAASVVEELWDRSWCPGCGAEGECDPTGDCLVLALYRVPSRAALVALLAYLDNENDPNCAGCGGWVGADCPAEFVACNCVLGVARTATR